MNKRYLGLTLIALAFIIARFSPFDGLSTANLALMMGLGAVAWIGVNMLMGTILPNPAGPTFSMWKMLLSGALGMMALFGIMITGVISTDQHVKKELQTYGVVTNAVVTGKDETTLPAKYGKVNHVYHLFVSFQDQTGTPHQVKSEVGEREYHRAYEGTPLKIRYSSRDVDVHKLIFE